MKSENWIEVEVRVRCRDGVVRGLQVESKECSLPADIFTKEYERLATDIGKAAAHIVRACAKTNRVSELGSPESAETLELYKQRIERLMLVEAVKEV